MVEGEEYSLAGSGGIRIPDPDPFICNDEIAGLKKKKKNKNKRRFSDDQIRSLELMFESETRLEPKKKIQVARELGLQPRQVAIWFQNKRARWKSKQLEKEYNLLRANYNNLASQYEALQKEKQALVTELENLNDAVQKTRDARQCCGKGVAPSSIDPESDGENRRCEPKVKQGCFENRAGGLSDNDTLKTEVFGFEEEPNLMSIVEPADSSLTTSDDWGSFNSDALLNQSSSSYPWWDFWS